MDGVFNGLEDLRVYIRKAIGDEDIFANTFVQLLWMVTPLIPDLIQKLIHLV